jgi:DNA-binding response OmpR family regulator
VGLPILLFADDDEGVAAALRQLGADVVQVGLFDEAPDRRPRAVVIVAGDRTDRAALSLRQLRRDESFEGVGALLCVSPRQVPALDPSAGFDDFVVLPATAVELYARIRQIEWRRSEFANDERIKVGRVVIDRAAREVSVDGRAAQLTAKEYALVAFLAQHRGRVQSREALLARVWGPAYDGGPRTVDIHVRRLRAKLGDALPLETLRGAGYVLRAPSAPTAPSAQDRVAAPLARAGGARSA